MITLSSLLKHYKRRDVQEALVEHADGREIAFKYGDSGYGKRPDVLQNPNDVIEVVKQGVTSFHASEERWRNPLLLSTDMRKQDLENLRVGWDLLLDIDCPVLDYSKIAADLLIKAIKSKGVDSLSVKFSGNHGFHIAVPFEAFPQNINVGVSVPTKSYFPDGVRVIASYLGEIMRKRLAEQLLKFEDIDEMLKKTGKTYADIVKNSEFDPYQILKIDTVLISSRHLYRMPYSFNEKSGLVSIPVDPAKVLMFDKEEAVPEKVVVERAFLPRVARPNEAKNLFDDAIHWSKQLLETKDLKEKFDYKERATRMVNKNVLEVTQAIPEEYWPPCMKLIGLGLKDGKKRALFAMTNFLVTIGWDYDKIEDYLRKWNERNDPPLREQVIVGHLRYHKQIQKKAPPYNCPHAGNSFFKDLGVCNPDGVCARIKNPTQYAKRRVWMVQQDSSKGKGKKKD